MEDWRNGGFGLYLHWPFCQSKCPYCDFNSHVAAKIDQKSWAAAYLTELDRYAELTPNRTLDSVFFGGGTPSLMDPDVVDSIMSRIRALWPVSNQFEVTLEANPSSVEAGRFAGYRDAGINRVSMGVQALNDADLKALGRLHSVSEAKAAFDIARSVFDRVSFDLIYARQHQTLDDWRAELTEALSMAIDHLSLYQLTIEDGTAFGARHAADGLHGLPSDDRAVDMFELTQELCSVASLPAYEVSNHAAPDAQSRHNLIYWRGGDYLGIGPGAHGRLTLDGTRYATEALKQPGAWLDAVKKGAVPEVSRETLNAQDHADEMLLMGLRLSEGISLSRIKAVQKRPLSTSKLCELQELDLIQIDGDRLATTLPGRMVLNGILRELVGED